MHSRTVEQVRSWDSRPFSGGFEALSSLSEAEHTGAIVAEDTWLFMLNGRVIGLFGGTMEDFDAEGTVYKTPHESLPLLFAMQEREGRTRAKYFTEDTPLREADKTLADANFTGYVELSENVLSGDYYLVYYGGTRRSAAFIGQSERVETGSDAFEKAAEEVGLYEVKDVSMTITEIPEPTPTATTDTDTAESEPAVASTSGGADATATEEAAESTASETNAHIDEATEQTASAESEPESGSPETGTGPESAEAEPGGTGTEAPTETEQPGEPEESAEPRGEAEPTGSRSEAEPTGSRRAVESTEPPVESEPAGTSGGTETAETEETETTRDPTDGTSGDVSDSELEKMLRAEAEWRQTRAIPALDPDETEPTDDSPDSDTKAAVSSDDSSGDPAPTQEPPSSKRTTRKPAETPERSRPDSQAREAESNAVARTPSQSRSESEKRRGQSRGQNLEAAVKKRDERIQTLESRLKDLDAQRSELESDLEAARSEREALESELDSLRKERDRLEARVEELEGAAGDRTGVETVSLTAAEAMSGTNLFVRYESKGEQTLEGLGDGIDQGAVNENLTLEHHTQFETEGARVDGKPFREFLEETGAFRFVSWVLRELPYELLETGNRTSLGDLFEAISEIDRIEFEGSVTVDAESGTDQRFAIVMRDRMGNPLVVGEYNDDRNPVTGPELEALLDGAREVAESVETLAGAFYVTASFFEPAALETAENAASTGGLFSRQEKASYVTPESGSGFHLGLVEDRSQAFHVTVPKL